MGFHVLQGQFHTLLLLLADFSWGFNGIQAPPSPSQVELLSDTLSEGLEQGEGYMRGSQGCTVGTAATEGQEHPVSASALV